MVGSQRALPCCVFLANCHVGGLGGCPVCNNGAEDVKHMLFTCDQARSLERARYLGKDHTPTRHGLIKFCNPRRSDEKRRIGPCTGSGPYRANSHWGLVYISCGNDDNTS